ncbi:hypothetical protein N0V95_006773, partial [Ascochyta clinopodiicola]
KNADGMLVKGRMTLKSSQSISRKSAKNSKQPISRVIMSARIRYAQVFDAVEESTGRTVDESVHLSTLGLKKVDFDCIEEQ